MATIKIRDTIHPDDTFETIVAPIGIMMKKLADYAQIQSQREAELEEDKREIDRKIAVSKREQKASLIAAQRFGALLPSEEELV